LGVQAALFYKAGDIIFRLAFGRKIGGKNFHPSNDRGLLKLSELAQG
jgi:hypothetical protein